jgi:hypothetical protein
LASMRRCVDEGAPEDARADQGPGFKGRVMDGLIMSRAVVARWAMAESWHVNGRRFDPHLAQRHSH